MSGLQEQVKVIRRWGPISIFILGTLIVWEDNRIMDFYTRSDTRITDEIWDRKNFDKSIDLSIYARNKDLMTSSFKVRKK